jgi:cystathionine beta-lyase
MSGFGGMMSFELSETLPLRKFLTSLKHIRPAMSLGGVESTITVPVFTSHAAMTEEARLESGVTPNLLRFSVGIEDEGDLIADLTQALGHAAADA